MTKLDPFNAPIELLRAPGNVSNLHSRVGAYARKNGLAPGRLYQRIYTELFLGLLAEAQARGIIPMYLLKGGMAIELRFGIRARASRDVDVGIVSGGENLTLLFDKVLAVGFAGFEFRRRGESRLLENASTYRIVVEMSYKGRIFGSLSVDLNEADYETASDVVMTGVIAALGLPGPLSVPILDTYLQIAQKLHGATEPSRPDYKNRRYRDLLDVLVFARSNEVNIDFRRLAEVCTAEFSRREHHRVWPPVFSLPPDWREPLEDEARANEFLPTDAHQLAREFIRFIARIEGVDVSEKYEYKFLNIQEITSGGGTISAAAQAELDTLGAEGWKVRYLAPHRHYADQFQAVLEREVSPPVKLPRMQMRCDTKTQPSQQVWLEGRLRNEEDCVANKVRVFMSGNNRVVRLGTITKGDGEVLVQLRFDDQPARTGPLQSPAVIVQFATDDGRKIQQSGVLDSYGPDASGRYGYVGLGLDPPIVIDKFTHVHDPLEIL
jgi:hypothetical protein